MSRDLAKTRPDKIFLELEKAGLVFKRSAFALRASARQPSRMF